ncbi:MAG: DUF1015 domain-containing protein [Bacillota bacterium]
MAGIIPFIGLRYNNSKISNLASVMTPPYDIIDDKSQARYYAENPVNIIRLELGLIFPDDDEQNNRYTRAKKYLDRWMEDETLVPEAKPAIYVYQQEFPGTKGTLTRTGFICGLKLEDYSAGSVLPHEETLSKPKADRLKLMQATQCNFSSIFGLYSDPERLVDKALLEAIGGREPDVNIVDEAGETHRLWVVTDEATLQAVSTNLREKQIFIADGHHRYETALEYCKQMHISGYKGYDYVMATLVNLYDEGLVVLPTHRVVRNISNLDLKGLKSALTEVFEVEEFDLSIGLPGFMNELANRGKKKHAFGLYTQERSLYLLTVKNMNQAKSLMPKEMSDSWKKLDVALLDNLVLSRLLRIDKSDRKNRDNISYTRDEDWAVARVNDGSHQLAFLLNPTRVEEVVAVAQAGDKMPQKSTYFYPKLLTGMVINPLFKNLP